MGKFTVQTRLKCSALIQYHQKCCNKNSATKSEGFFHRWAQMNMGETVCIGWTQLKMREMVLICGLSFTADSCFINFGMLSSLQTWEWRQWTAISYDPPLKIYLNQFWHCEGIEKEKNTNILMNPIQRLRKQYTWFVLLFSIITVAFRLKKRSMVQALESWV